MQNDLFEAVKAQIDRDIDALVDAPAGIRMSFALAGEFLARNLLAACGVDLLGFHWDMRTYRDRIVYPGSNDGRS